MMEPKIKTAVLFDLDSTVFDTRARWHLSPMRKMGSTWADYAMACHLDVALPGTVAAMRLHWPHHEIHLCSGRDGSARDLTKRMLMDVRAPYDVLSLRQEGDRRVPAEVKVAYIRELQARGIEPVLFYEDWPEVAEAIYKETNVPVLVVNPCYGDTVGQEG